MVFCMKTSLAPDVKYFMVLTSDVQKHEGAAGRLALRARGVEGDRPRPEVGKVRGRHGCARIRGSR